MNKKWLFGGGLVLLGVIGVGFAVKKLYFDKKKADKDGETEDDREDGYQGDFEDDEDCFEDEEFDDEPVEVNPEPKPEPEETKEYKEYKASSYTDYKGLYDDDDEEEDPDLSEIDMDISQEHLDDSDKEPEVIDGGSLGELSNRWDQETLYFYQENGALVDESMTELKDPFRFVGMTIEDSGFVDNDELMLFVKNYQFDTVYTIQKIKGAFGDE